MEMAERLRRAREEAGYRSAAEAARAFGWNEVTYRAHENGVRGLKREAVDKYAGAFRVSPVWLWSGEGAPDKRNTVMVLGYVGAGAEVFSIDDLSKGDGLEEVELDFPVPYGSIALVVRGDSQYPIFEDGDLIGYHRHSEDPAQLVGRMCIVRLLDGRTFLKRLRKGAQPGLFTLVSANAPDIEDVPVEWAARYTFHIPSYAWRKAR
ncbi:helix-turn-helix domain-containing protein [Ancylobacter sonchi]|nr:helix-turn-helix domain-containing protein [Ancylobacter sonchi]